MSTKELFLQEVATLPENSNWEMLLNDIRLQKSLVRADEDISAGRVYTTDAGKNRVRELARKKHGCNLDR